MTLASAGWGTWWILLFLHRFAPGLTPGLGLPGFLSTVFALAGLLVALLTVRARRSWILFSMIPLLANVSLLFVPTLAGELFAGGAG